MHETVLSILRPTLIAGDAGLLIAAGAVDILTRTISNRLIAALALFGAALRVIDGTLLPAMAVAAAVFTLTFLLWRRGWLGGGDVKLLAAEALAVPPGSVPAMLSAVTVTGAILAIGYLLAARLVAAPKGPRPTTLLGRAWRTERWRLRRGGPLPYAVAIAAGGLLIMFPGA